MKTTVTTKIENVTDSINHFLCNQSNEPTYQTLTTDTMLRSYVNAVLPNNYKQAISVIRHQVWSKNQIEHFTLALITAFKQRDTTYSKLIWNDLDSFSSKYNQYDLAISFNILKDYLQIGVDKQTTMIVLFGVLAELVNKNKHYFILNDLSDLLDEAKLVCLTQILIELESIPNVEKSKAAA